MQFRIRVFFFGVFFPFILLSACAPSVRHETLVEQNLLSHRYAEADAVVEKNQNAYGDRNALLYYLDRAFLLHLSGRYAESNTFFEKAAAKVDELYTQSITTHAGALLTNDNLLPYEGDDFEKVLIPLFSSLNYAALGQWEDALVEARQVDARLNLLNDRYSEKNVYKEDAFARYLSGILYEARREWNDAFISDRRAYEVFQDYRKYYQTPIPSRVGLDLIRLSKKLHLQEELKEYKKTFPQWGAQESNPLSENEGELLVVTYEGRSPVKEDHFINAPIPDGSGGTYVLRVALPKFVSRPSDVDEVKIILQRGETVIRQRSDLLEDITAIAKKNLEDRVGRITAKAIARATTKYLATLEAKKEAKKRGGEGAAAIVGLVGNIGAAATEGSDKRSWRTLPGKIHLARISLPTGEWNVKIGYYSRQGRLIEERQFSRVMIEKGGKRFLLDETLR